MDFEHSPRVKELQARLATFMDEHVYPNEARFFAEVEANKAQGNGWVPTRVMEEMKAKGMRGAIARRMTQSLQTAAQLSHFSEVDATRLLQARAQFVAHADTYGTRVSVNAFVVKAIAQTLVPA